METMTSMVSPARTLCFEQYPSIQGERNPFAVGPDARQLPVGRAGLEVLFADEARSTIAPSRLEGQERCLKPGPEEPAESQLPEIRGGESHLVGSQPSMEAKIALCISP